VRAGGARALRNALSSAIPFRVRPMLATLVREPFNADGWTYEEKYDGIRILAYKEGSRVQLLSRNAVDRTHSFPGIVGAIQALGSATLLLDGEVVLFDKKHVSRFQLLQRGGQDPIYAVFDCLYKQGKDLRQQPLSARRAALEESVLPDKFLLISSVLGSHGIAAYRVAKCKGFEGVVAKDLSSPYVEGRSTLWLKVKVHQEDEFVIGGFTQPSGTRKFFGALLLGAYDREQLKNGKQIKNGKKLHYVGKVGTGFGHQTLAALHRMFVPLIRDHSYFVDPPRGKGITFLEPKLVAQISYQEWTADGLLRQPVFLGLRDDKSPAEVVRPAPMAMRDRA
jgi:bifunctional non-homologous end joining protein LigD